MEKQIQFEVKNVEGEGVVSGWGNVYEKLEGGQWVKVLDRGGDLIERGALAEGKRIPILLHHSPEKPIGKGYAYEREHEGKYGIWVELRLAVDSESEKLKESAKYVYSLLKEKIFNAFSIGFGVNDSETVRHKGQRARLIKELELFEISVVMLGMNQEALVSSVKHSQGSETSSSIAMEFLAAKDEEIAEGVTRADLEDEMAWLHMDSKAIPHIERIRERAKDITGVRAYNLQFILKDYPSRQYFKEAVQHVQNPYVEHYIMNLIEKHDGYDSLSPIQ